LLIFIAFSDLFLHWYVLPVLICGLLIGPDLVAWLRGRLDHFDPVGIVGAIGFHIFFLAPLLHVYWDFWLRSVEHPPDWRPWLGAMATLNIFGLLLYQGTRYAVAQTAKGTYPRLTWKLNSRYAPVVLSAALLLSLLVQIYVYAQVGGISGYIQRFEQRMDATTPPSAAFRGFGALFMFSEAFPSLALISFTLLIHKRTFARHRCVVIVVILAFFVLQMLFGGLRGSRSNTILTLFWAAGVVHVWFRPVSKRMIGIGVIGLLLFMQSYTFYEQGTFSLTTSDLHMSSTHDATTDERLRTVLLRDLNRADVQAFLLYRVMRPESDYVFTWGRAYLGDLAILIPRSVWKNIIGIPRPPSRTYEATEAMFGQGSFVEDEFFASNVYGIGAEALLSFGPVAVPIAYVVLGIVTGLVRQLMFTMPRGDIRWFIYPLLVILCFNILVGDLINVVSFLLMDAFFLSLTITLITRFEYRRHAH
jgi:hypothetical protein